MTDNIIELNRDRETALIQCGYGRSKYFKDPFQPLRLLHFSDIHAVLPLWNRMVEYLNHYSDHIDLALHTGDYCGGMQEAYVDFYEEGTPTDKVILNCVGNHDVVTTEKWIPNTKESAHSLLFNHTENWGVTFQDIPYAMNYSKDFPSSNIRLIVLDQYYDHDRQLTWLRELLERSLKEGVHVITASHEQTDHIVSCPDTAFNSAMDYTAVAPLQGKTFFEDTLVDFINKGGHHVCHLAGHRHHDHFGYTAQGVLNICVECGTDWYHWCDSRRVAHTRTWDCFNVMGVDVNRQLLKIVRIGDDTDCFMRKKTVLCYDYGKKTVIHSC